MIVWARAFGAVPDEGVKVYVSAVQPKELKTVELAVFHVTVVFALFFIEVTVPSPRNARAKFAVTPGSFE